MRRYGRDSNNTITVKGRSSGIKFGLSPTVNPVVEAIPCKVSPSGLFWYNDESTKFDQISEVGLIESYSDNVSITPDFVLTKAPFNFHAQLQGELCLCSGYTVEWRVEWSGTNPPLYNSSGGDIFVTPREDSFEEAGVMTILAVLKDKSKSTVYMSGEIYLVITSASYYYTISQGGVTNNLGGWMRLLDNYAIQLAYSPA